MIFLFGPAFFLLLLLLSVGERNDESSIAIIASTADNPGIAAGAADAVTDATVTAAAEALATEDSNEIEDVAIGPKIASANGTACDRSIIDLEYFCFS